MAIKNRYEFIMLFDVENGNPNGDPDAGNSPRIDVETGCGFITDVCLKRKIRDYVELLNDMDKIVVDANNPKGYNILIKPDKALNTKFKESYDKLNIDKDNVSEDEKVEARNYICKNYFDVRTFGAVMSTGKTPCGIVRGPVQINFATSISPITVDDICITRQARTTEERTESGDTEMGRKSIIPYALYKAEGYVSAALANKITDLTESDLDILWDAIINMFEHDHSAARGKMCMRKLYIFKHSCVLGDCPSFVLFDKLDVRLKEEVIPRKYSDYIINIDKSMPNGVELIEKL